jgi:hypothetical protein
MVETAGLSMAAASAAESAAATLLPLAALTATVKLREVVATPSLTSMVKVSLPV